MKVSKKIIAIFAILTILLSTVFTNFAFAYTAYTVDITSEDQSLNGRTYDAYEIFTITSTTTENNTTKYTYEFASPTTKAAFENAIKSLNSTVTTTTDAVDFLANITDKNTLNNFAKKYIEQEGIPATAIHNVTKDVVTVSDKGYYLIHQVDATEPYSKNILMNITENNTKTSIKANVPTVTKTSEKPTAKVGEKVGFTITGKALNPSGYTNYSYKLVDTLTNLDYVKNSISIYVDSVADANKITLSADKITEPTADNNQTLTIDLTDWLKNNVDKLEQDATKTTDIIVKYNATLTEGAIQENKATNTVEVKYTTNGTEEQTGGTSTVDVYTYEVEFTKTDLQDSPIKNNTATFKLKQDGKNVPLKLENGKYIVTGEASDSETGTPITTNADDGKFTIEGLSEGTYTLEETQAPNKYKKHDCFTFKIFQNKTENQTNKVSISFDEKKDLGLYKVTSNNVDFGTLLKANLRNSNNDSSLLPTTGGIGTTIFTITGVAVMAIAVVAIVVYNKKQSKKEN